MDDSQFQELVDDEFVRIEDRIDELALDADIDTAGDVLSITLETGGSIILSRQIANHEIWVAAKSGGFHLARDGDRWWCATTNEDLDTLINRVFTEQAGTSLF
ncbi:MAG: iron donor protein CyaY [Pseudomonadales bacterium]|nr:iron donor protein CyaY [Pseudomonadales bacterium]MBO6596557.1 iron donor protein CyaY [Pseudomonadales bacterium]MBO6656447.1 iron donor protein CyaY [Pseudomonadales bacterium]MBO6703252.1 iron donor protein CyaY [Pseudomonadales bacterium]MBO6823454.1 iron donor protein CyaY [Pseudomonadales bacterium]